MDILDTLTNWSARRSGGRITITARDDTGSAVKVPNVDRIELQTGGERSRIVAVDKDGDEYELALA